MQTFNQIKRNIKYAQECSKAIKLSLLGDTATQFLSIALQGTAIERGYKLDLFEAEYNQVERQVMDRRRVMRKILSIVFVCILALHANAINVVFRLDDPSLQADSVSLRAVHLLNEKQVPLSIAMVACDSADCRLCLSIN